MIYYQVNIIIEQGKNYRKKLQGRAFAMISCEISTLVPVNTSPEKKNSLKREGKLHRSATALKQLTIEVNNTDYMAQCHL